VYFRRDVRSGVRKAGSALHDASISKPWEVDLCQYHTHNDTPTCDRKETGGLLTRASSVEQSAPPITPRRSPRKTTPLMKQKRVIKPQAHKKR